jgi:SAM-dependent methyltransferase
MNDDIRTLLRESYNRKATYRDMIEKQPWKVAERQHFLSLLQHEHKRTLLELGAGTGKDSKFFQDHGLAVVCIDLAPAMITLCHQKGLVTAVADIGALPFPAASFEAVYAFNCLFHLPKREFPAVLRRLATILKPNGLFYIGMLGGFEYEGVWTDDSYDPQRFFSFFTDEHLQQVVANVFSIRSFKRMEVNEQTGQPQFQALVVRKP